MLVFLILDLEFERPKHDSCAAESNHCLQVVMTLVTFDEEDRWATSLGATQTQYTTPYPPRANDTSNSSLFEQAA